MKSVLAKITVFFVTLAVTLSTMFGVFEPSTTGNPEDYIDNEIKNVIYLIGDGMGFNHLEKTKDEMNTKLIMDTFPVKGGSMSRSMNKKVTDSAAGGTALSVGVRTNNSVIGAYHLDKHSRFCYPKSLTELCIERGMKTGVVTTDETTGATPASFSAHSSDRNNAEDIVSDQLSSDIDLIWGLKNNAADKKEVEKNGFTYVSTYSEMMALEEDSRSYGQFTDVLWGLKQSNKNTPTLEQMAVKAVDLLDDTDEGFFIMIEGAHIDKHSHSNDSAKMTESLLEFDKTVEAMLEYAKADGETLVIVTADHETGAIVHKDGGYIFTSGSHSGVDVPLLVYGSDKLINNGDVINNFEIPIRIAYLLGAQKSQFPVAVLS